MKQDPKDEIVRITFPVLKSSLNLLKARESLIFMKYLATIPVNPTSLEERTVKFSLQDFQDLLGANVTREDISGMLTHLSNQKIKVPMKISFRTKEGQKRLKEEVDVILFVPLLIRGESEDKSLFVLQLSEQLAPAVSTTYQRYAVASISDLQSLKGSPRAQSLHRFLLMNQFNACVKRPDVPGGEIEVDIDTLREELGMTGKSYDSFKEFNRTLKEISEAVNQTYTKHTFRKGKMKPGTHEVSTIVFTYLNNPMIADTTTENDGKGDR